MLWKQIAHMNVAHADGICLLSIIVKTILSIKNQSGRPPLPPAPVIDGKGSNLYTRLPVLPYHDGVSG